MSEDFSDQQAYNVYDPATNGSISTTNLPNTVYTYDPGDNRLHTESFTTTNSGEQSYVDTYTYDNVGNRLTKTHVVGTSTLSITDTYDSHGDDRLMTETATGTGAYSTSYSYDNNGSLITEVRTGSGATSNSYTYDVQNHLISATIGSTTTGYTYDASGNRVSSTQGSSTTYYTIDDSNPTGYSQILEEAATLGGTPTETYVVGQAVLGQANSSGTLSYLVTDGHGSTRILADAGGGITDRYDFDAFGNALTSTSGTQILYAGQFLDPATGLYDLRARNYDPTTGRFTSFDSFAGNIDDPITLEKFIYAAADPINLVDPGGKQFGDFLELVISVGSDLLVSGFEAAKDIYGAYRALGAVEQGFAVAGGTTVALENLINGPQSLAPFGRLTIGFIGGYIQGLLSFESPTAASALGSLIVDTANVTFSDEKFSWSTFGKIVADAAVQAGLAGALNSVVGKLLTGVEDNLTNFLISFDATFIKDDIKGFSDFGKALKV